MSKSERTEISILFEFLPESGFLGFVKKLDILNTQSIEIFDMFAIHHIWYFDLDIQITTTIQRWSKDKEENENKLREIFWLELCLYYLEV